LRGCGNSRKILGDKAPTPLGDSAVKRDLIFSLMLCFSLLMFRVAAASSELDDIARLIDKYEKEAIINFILTSRDNQITVSNKDSLTDFYGPPDPDYVTPETIFNDFEIIGISPDGFERMENRRRLHIEKSIKSESDHNAIRAPTGGSSNLLYKAAYSSVPIRTAPNYSAAQIGEIPEGTIVEAVEEKVHWIKVRLEDKEGWAPVALELVEEAGERKALLYCSLYGTKSTENGEYRSFIKIQNVGNKDFAGSLMIYAYSADRVVFFGFQHFKLDPVAAGGGRTIYIQTKEPITSLETSYQ
jgi:hypothetical protein